MSEAWNWAGAKWWKFDFHNHTPASDDYGKGSNQEQDKQITPKEWLLNYMRQEIDCVAVTDHNSGAWIDKLKTALHELESEGHEEYRKLFLFPGVEITVQGDIHILAIFDQDKNTSDIDSLLGAVKYRDTKGKSDGCTSLAAGDVINEIEKSGGIAIPAHVDQAKGLFNEFKGNTLEQILDSKSIFAMEVREPEYKKPQLYINKKLNWAEVLGSDSHHPGGTDGQRYPGSHYTWVKMSRPSYEGLKLALFDGNLSLKRSDLFSGDPNTYGQLAIESIVVNDGKYLGRKEAFSCQLNPWLNTIIGGRGTGKSTSLEFIRVALKRKEEIPKSLEKEIAKYSLTSKNRHDEGLLTDATKITVGFRKDGRSFRIKWSNDNDKYTIEEEVKHGKWITSEGDIAQRFPVRIYSQKQIFELAKDPQALLRIVDDAPIVNYRDWKNEMDNMVSDYISTCNQIRRIQAELQEESVIKGQLDDIKGKLDVFEKAEHKNILKTYQLTQNQKNAIDTWEKTWDGVAQDIRNISTDLLPSELDLQHFDAENEDNKMLINAIKNVHLKFENFQKDLNLIAHQIDNLKNEWNYIRHDLEITKKITDAAEKYTSFIDKINVIGAGDPSSYGMLVKQRQSFNDKLIEIEKNKETIKKYQNSAGEYLIKLTEHRRKITKYRMNFLNDTLKGNSYVEIDVVPFGNTNTIEDELRKLIDRSGGGFERDIGEVGGDDGILAILSRDVSKTQEEKIKELKALLVAIYENDASAVSNVKDKRFVNHIQGLDPVQIDKIRCWFPDDSLNVKYSSNRGKSFMPIAQGSPGQKTAALLAFILSYGEEPLLLDQPEDDLDNNLIYELIVSQLREIKQKRQILVITHNANVVVNGDAENVIVLDIHSGQTRIVTQGGLQERSVRDKICHVMEGGKEAFDKRYKRINA